MRRTCQTFLVNGRFLVDGLACQVDPGLLVISAEYFCPCGFPHICPSFPLPASTMDWLVRSFQVLRSLMDPLVGATQPVSQDDRSTPLFICCCCSYIQHRYSYLLICILWFSATFCKTNAEKKDKVKDNFNLLSKQSFLLSIRRVIRNNLQNFILCVHCTLRNDATYQE